MKRIAFTMALALVAGGAYLDGQSASPFARTRVTHVGVVVRDVAAAVKVYADLFGVPAPAITVAEGIKFRPDYRGDTTPSARPKVAVVRLANLDIELIEPQGASSVWRSFLDSKGEGLHHVGLAVPDVAQAVTYMEAHGAPVILGGVPGSTFNYLDLTDRVGTIIEPDDAKAFAARRVPSYPADSFALNNGIHVSTIVRDVAVAGDTAARVLGLPRPPSRSGGGGARGLSFPASYKGDRAAGPQHVTFPLNDGIELELTEPVGGSSPWRDHLDTYGPSMHHVAFAVKDLAGSIAFLSGKGGTLTLGGDGKVFYAYVDLKPRPLGFTFELNGPR